MLHIRYLKFNVERKHFMKHYLKQFTKVIKDCNRSVISIMFVRLVLITGVLLDSSHIGGKVAVFGERLKITESGVASKQVQSFNRNSTRTRFDWIKKICFIFKNFRCFDGIVCRKIWWRNLGNDGYTLEKVERGRRNKYRLEELCKRVDYALRVIHSSNRIKSK